MPAVPLPVVKEHLDIKSATHDAELQDMTRRAEAVLAKLVGPLAPVPVTETHTGPGPLLLKRWPIVAVTSATSDGVTVTDVELGGGGLLHGTFGYTARGVQVTYTVGRELDDDLEMAVLELVRHFWQTQRGNGPSPLDLQDGEEAVTPAGSYLLPYRVQSLIEPYLIQTSLA